MDILDSVQKVVIGLSQIDQDCAVLDTVYNKSSQTKVLQRIEESIGELMSIRENVKGLGVEHYKGTNFESLITKPK